MPMKALKKWQSTWPSSAFHDALKNAKINEFNQINSTSETWKCFVEEPLEERFFACQVRNLWKKGTLRNLWKKGGLAI